MPINRSLLTNVKELPKGKTVAECPACAETGHDKTGDHLVVYANGRFGCVANPGDRAHRQRVAQLVGVTGPVIRPWTLKPKEVLVQTGVQAVPGPVPSLARSNFTPKSCPT